MATTHQIDLGETEKLAEDARAVVARAAGSEEAFSLLVYRQNRFVFRVAYALLRSVPDAEDVAQETFLKLFRTLFRDDGWKGIRDERAFLARMAWRLARDRQRGAPREHAELDEQAMASRLASPEDQVVSADLTAAIFRLIDALPEELRQPLLLSSVDQMTSREIAGVLGVAEGTVRTRLQRARSLLKEKLNRRKEAYDAR